MSAPLAVANNVDEFYWTGLHAGELRYQYCERCDHGWLPAREHCPNCLRETSNWRRSGGDGHIISWVVYHVAYHESFKDKLPYNVSIVQIDEGPRLLTNVIAPLSSLRIGDRVKLRIEYEDTQVLARFELSGDGE
jgi:uncharacterized OB-fold protein